MDNVIIAPGMRFRLKGSVDHNRFRVRSLAVVNGEIEITVDMPDNPHTQATREGQVDAAREEARRMDEEILEAHRRG
mgnify:CR=1 FL=1